MSNTDPKANDPRRFDADQQKRKDSTGHAANDPRQASDAARSRTGEKQQEQAGQPQRQQGAQPNPAHPHKTNDQQR